MRRPSTMRAAVVSASLALATGAWMPATATPAPRAGEVVTLRHAATQFRAQAPRGFRLVYRGGVYTISGPRLRVTVTVLRTRAGARSLGRSRLRGTRGRVILRRGNARRFVALSDRGGRRVALRVVRRRRNLVVTTSVYPRGRPGLARIAEGIAASARGGRALRRVRRAAPAPATPAPATPAPAPVPRLFPLRPYRAPDGGATAWVPADPDWTVQSSQGSLEGSSPRGGFLLGQTFSIFYPGTIPPSPTPLPPSVFEHPFVSAADALRLVVPIINQRAGVNLTDMRIRQLIGDATLPTFRSSGMFVYDFKVDGRPWVGVANIATEDRLSPTFNQFWQMYISSIAVPADGDPTVGAGLRLVWRSWNPSGAIAARSERGRQILSEINETWRGVSEFRSRTADQQSRDVSCLLRTGPFIDDNARQLGLPPLLDCDSTYVRRSGT